MSKTSEVGVALNEFAEAAPAFAEVFVQAKLQQLSRLELSVYFLGN
jgi:hypothetical protein